MKTQGATFVAAIVTLLSTGQAFAQDIDALEELGDYVFFDNISVPGRQGCHTCHVPANGWTGGVAGFNKKSVALPGANPKTIGRRKPPSNAYASFSPPFGTKASTVTATVVPPETACAQGLGAFCTGGVFWDGRAEGRPSPLIALPNVTGQGAVTHVGLEIFPGNAFKSAYGRFIGPLADQALGPFPNDVEQNVPDGNDHGLAGSQFVCEHVRDAAYAPLYEQAWGEPINCSQPDIAFKRITLSLAAWQSSAEVNSFSSRRDQGNQITDAQGKKVLALPITSLTDQENLGHLLFYTRAKCASCHNNHNSILLGAPLASQGNELDQTYADHAYHNIGVPPNFQIANFVNQGDTGALEHTNPNATFSPQNPSATPFAGEFKTPTLRNVDKRRGQGFTKAYMHNGYFKSLEQVVHFYNTSILLRDPVKCPAGTTANDAIAKGCWPTAEFDTPNQASGVGLLGNLGLTEEEEAAIVAYLKTLTDTQTPKQPPPFKGGKGNGNGPNK